MEGAVKPRRQLFLWTAGATVLLFLLVPAGIWLKPRQRTPVLEVAAKARGARAPALFRGWDLAAAAERRQCPPMPRNGSGLSVAFLHVPKTAGTLLVESMRAMMPREGKGRWCIRGGKNADLAKLFIWCGLQPPNSGWADPDPGQLELVDAVKTRFPSDCAGFSTHHDIRFFDQAGIHFTRTLTLVAFRHPAERLLSDYYYGMHRTPEAMANASYAPAHDGDYAGLLRYARELGHERHTRQLAGAFGCRWPGGPTTRPEGRAMLEAAKRNLERFCVLIIAELMHESRARLAQAAGWDANEFARVSTELEGKASSGKLNSNPHPLLSALPGEVRRELERVNSLDMELYEYALRLFVHGPP